MEQLDPELCDWTRRNRSHERALVFALLLVVLLFSVTMFVF